MSKALRRVSDEIEKLDLSPQVRQFIRVYTDPLLPTFGSPTKSAHHVGMEPSSGEALVRTVGVKKAVALIEEERDAAAIRATEGLMRYAADAAREIVGQLAHGRELEHVEVGDMMREAEALEKASSVQTGSEFERTMERHRALIRRMQETTKHNRVVANVADVRREAALKILDSAMRALPKGGNEKSAPRTLGSLSDEELQALGAALESVKSSRSKTVVVDAEVEEG